MVSRRQVLTGFLSIPAVIFANKALAHHQAASILFPPEAGPRSLWGQAMIEGIPWGEPFLMEAMPASRGMATFTNSGVIQLPPAPFAGTLEVEIFSAEYGSLGRSPLKTSGPITEDCSVEITSVVMGRPDAG